MAAYGSNLQTGPEVRIIDSHHHFWDPTRREYYWMGGDELASIRKPIGPEDMRPLLSQNNVDRTVLVQTVPSVEETREFLAIAAATDYVAGVVGWVVVVVVNVASKCGLTPQYEKLQSLHQKYADKGLAVLGFPCNQFGGQAGPAGNAIACVGDTGTGNAFRDRQD